jgi:DNA-binding FadR family transcriptional regulator
MGEAYDTAVDVCEAKIRRQILHGVSRAGDRLPPERALAAQLGVNRTTLRAALTRLVRVGLLRVRQGSGYVVQDCLRAGGVELAGELVGAGGVSIERMARELLEIRRALVRIALVEIASRRATASDDVARAVERFGELARSGATTEELAAADEEMLAALLAAAPAVALTFNSLSLAIRSLAPLRDALYDDPCTHLALAWKLARWSARPSVAALGELLAELELRDRSVLSVLDAPPRERAPTTLDQRA